MTAAAVAPELPGRHAVVHFDGSAHAAAFPAAGVDALAAVVADFEPSGHEPNGQCDVSEQRAVAAGCAGTAGDFAARCLASAMVPLASANAAASAITDRMRFMELS